MNSILIIRYSVVIHLLISGTILTAFVNTFQENVINSIDNKYQTYDKYDRNNNKCEIRIVTSGVCSVNNHLVKPRIDVKFSNHFKNVAVYEKPRNEERVRNMKNDFKIEEQKANHLVDQFLIKFKEHFGQQIDPMIIPQFGRFKLKDMGLIRVYELLLRGVSNMKRQGSVRLHSDSQMKLWIINTNLTISNITADFKVDAQLKNRVFINGWALQILIKECLLNAVIEFNSQTKMMSISSLMVINIEGFTLNSENLSWPFSQLVQHILDHQMNDLKTVISSNAQKYMSETLKSFDVTKIVDNMNK